MGEREESQTSTPPLSQNHPRPGYAHKTARQRGCRRKSLRATRIWRLRTGCTRAESTATSPKGGGENCRYLPPAASQWPRIANEDGSNDTDLHHPSRLFPSPTCSRSRRRGGTE